VPTESIPDVAETSAWADEHAVTFRLADSGRTAFELPVRSLDAAITVRMWFPADAPDDERLPLLGVHDGPEYETLASLTHYLSAGLAGHWLPRLRGRGYPATLHEVPDMHNYTAWRDAFQPYLTELLGRASR